MLSFPTTLGEISKKIEIFCQRVADKEISVVFIRFFSEERTVVNSVLFLLAGLLKSVK